jgi:hypothetical protein
MDATFDFASQIKRFAVLKDQTGLFVEVHDLIRTKLRVGCYEDSVFVGSNGTEWRRLN